MINYIDNQSQFRIIALVLIVFNQRMKVSQMSNKITFANIMGY